MPFFLHIAAFLHSLFKSRRQLALENLALRQQLAMLKPSVKRLSMAKSQFKLPSVVETNLDSAFATGSH